MDEKRWEAAFQHEIRRQAERTPDRVVSSVFFGGGTPSLMSSDLVSSILETIFSAWTPANNIEVTLEANPTSVDVTRFRGYRDGGVNRVSLGVQALNDHDLRRLGRTHSAAEALRGIEVARSTFERVSFDLIYSRQFQDQVSWQYELRRALSLQPDHVSLYQLTIEDGTAFGARHARGQLPGLPEEDLAADLYFETQEICDQAGLPAYEISNHAKRGQESQHNLIYWRGGDYVGVGPGAHGRYTCAGSRYATETILSPTQWLDHVERKGHGEILHDEINGTARAREYVMMGLRLSHGIDLERLLSFDPGFDLSPCDMLEEYGLVACNNGSLRVTRDGRPLLNAILRELF